MSVTIKSNSESVRVYINDTLHLRFPRDKNMKIQSWIEGCSGLYYIEIRTNEHTDLSAYEDRHIWESILNIIDKNT